MRKELQIILLLGAIYFYLVAFFHFFGLKVPVFYVYYDVDSTVYQDRIISVLSFIFATFLFAGYRLKNKELVSYILFSGSVAVFGLAVNNFSTRIAFRNNSIYWMEIGFLAVYVLILAFYSKKQG